VATRFMRSQGKSKKFKSRKNACSKYPNLGAFATCTMDLMYVKRKTEKVGSTIVLITRP
jgi:hypothetical protein